MKRGTTAVIPVKILLNHEDIKSVDFIIKEKKESKADTLISRNYPEDVVFNGEFYLLELTEEETTSLNAGVVYLDTRIVTKEDKIPNTRIVTVRVDDTLFGESM